MSRRIYIATSLTSYSYEIYKCSYERQLAQPLHKVVEVDMCVASVMFKVQTIGDVLLLSSACGKPIAS